MYYLPQKDDWDTGERESERECGKVPLSSLIYLSQGLMTTRVEKGFATGNPVPQCERGRVSE